MNITKPSNIALALSLAAKATADLLLALNQGRCKPSHWVRWCFALESLPLFSASLLTQIRSLAWHGATQPAGKQPSAYDVQMTFRRVQLLVLGTYLAAHEHTETEAKTATEPVVAETS